MRLNKFIGSRRKKYLTCLGSLLMVVLGFLSCQKNSSTPHFTLRELYVVRTVNGQPDTLYRPDDERVEITVYPDLRLTNFVSIAVAGEEQINLTSKYGFSPITNYNVGCPLGNVDQNEYLYLFSRGDNYLGIRQMSVSFFRVAGSLVGFPLEDEKEGPCNGFVVMSPI